MRRILMMIIKKEREVDVWLYHLDKLGDEGKVDMMRATVQSGDEAQSRDPPKLREAMSLMRRLH